MAVRYLSSESTIAAAGAAFACHDDDYSDLTRARMAAANASRLRFQIKRFFSNALVAMGLARR